MKKYEYRQFKSSYYHFSNDLTELLEDGWLICSEIKIIEDFTCIMDEVKRPCYFTTLKRLIKQ